MKRLLQQLVHGLAVMAVMVHLWGGCCFHHAHADDSALPDAFERGAACGCLCGHAGATEGTPDRRGTPPNDCGEHPCAFAVPGSSSAGWAGATQLPDDLPAVAISDGALPGAVLAGASDAASWASREGESPPRCGRLRPHLLKRVLLL